MIPKEHTHKGTLFCNLKRVFNLNSIKTFSYWKYQNQKLSNWNLCLIILYLWRKTLMNKVFFPFNSVRWFVYLVNSKIFAIFWKLTFKLKWETLSICWNRMVNMLVAFCVNRKRSKKNLNRNEAFPCICTRCEQSCLCHIASVTRCIFMGKKKWQQPYTKRLELLPKAIKFSIWNYHAYIKLYWCIYLREVCKRCVLRIITNEFYIFHHWIIYKTGIFCIKYWWVPNNSRCFFLLILSFASISLGKSWKFQNTVCSV